MAMSEIELRLEAVNRYLENSRKSEINDAWSRIIGKPNSLLKFEEVANRLHIRQQIPIGHQMVKLNQIVGSVGRYREFTKNFLPRPTVMQDRWVAVDVTMNSLKGFPPVELYKIGEAYFVIDGNHRISVSRANGNKDIEANVIECQTSVSFSLEDFLGDKWLIKAAYGEFLTQTHLDQLRPGAHLEVTQSEHYDTILQHIAVHRYLSNRPQRNAHGAWENRHLSWADAVVSWYDKVYRPVVEAMHAQQLLARFPKRTETDLYIAITQYRERVAEQYELAPLGDESAATVFAANHSDWAIGRFVLAVRQRIRQSVSQTLNQTLGQLQAIPAGMTHAEFSMLRLRHDAGELSITEAQRKAAPEPHYGEPVCEGGFGVPFSA